MSEPGTVEYMQKLLLKNEAGIGRLGERDDVIGKMLLRERKSFKRDIQKEIKRLEAIHD